MKFKRVKHKLQLMYYIYSVFFVYIIDSIIYLLKSVIFSYQNSQATPRKLRININSEAET